jgi:hypothetical protein
MANYDTVDSGYPTSPFSKFVGGFETGWHNMMDRQKQAMELRQLQQQYEAGQQTAKNIQEDRAAKAKTATLPAGDPNNPSSGGSATGGTGGGGGGGGGGGVSSGNIDYSKSEPGNGFLKDQRQKMADEVKNTPGLQDKLLAIASLEDDRDPAGPLESLFNRAAMTGKSLTELLGEGNPNSFYGPIRRGMLPGRVAEINKNEKVKAYLQSGLDYVIGGSNRLQGATDQGMAGDPNAETTSGLILPPDGTKGAIYNDWGGWNGGVAGSAKWRQEQQAQVKSYVPPTQTAAAPGDTGAIPDVPHYGTDLTKQAAAPTQAIGAPVQTAQAPAPTQTAAPAAPPGRGGLGPNVKFNSQGVPYNPDMVAGGSQGAAPSGVRIPARPSAAATAPAPPPADDGTGNQSYNAPSPGYTRVASMEPHPTNPWGPSQVAIGGVLQQRFPVDQQPVVGGQQYAQAPTSAPPQPQQPPQPQPSAWQGPGLPTVQAGNQQFALVPINSGLFGSTG